MDKETFLLMTLSHNNLQALNNSSAEKFKRRMDILYEDEHNLLNKIQKNANFQNSNYNSRRYNTSSLAMADTSIYTAARTDAKSNMHVNVASVMNTSVISPLIMEEDQQYGLGKHKQSHSLMRPPKLNLTRLNKVQPKA